jgi:hypothetical protein
LNSGPKFVARLYEVDGDRKKRPRPVALSPIPIPLPLFENISVEPVTAMLPIPAISISVPKRS